MPIYNPKLRFAHVFDKKETMFDKLTAGVVGELTKNIVTKFVSGIENNQSNPLGKILGEALLFLWLIKRFQFNQSQRKTQMVKKSKSYGDSHLSKIKKEHLSNFEAFFITYFQVLLQ